jgi:hypothetical protein
MIAANDPIYKSADRGSAHPNAGTRSSAEQFDAHAGHFLDKRGLFRNHQQRTPQIAEFAAP